jgi:pantetheine-phosphate adenylyltransferase
MKITDKSEKFNELGLDKDILRPYREPHRFYHTIDHLNDIWSQLELAGFGDNDTLLLATIFHDIIYDPRSATNEEDSARYFSEVFNGDDAIKDEVIQIILDTKDHLPKSKLSKIFSKADLNILNQPFEKLLKYEHQIFKEFQFVDHSIYKKKRIEVLNQLRDSVDNPDLARLVDYVTFRQPSIALYPGSFDPFHKGHYNILQKAENIFDKVIVARGINPGKDKAAHDLPETLKYRQTALYEGLLTDFTDGLGYNVTLIRGLRNGSDLQYELNQYRYLQELSDKGVSLIAIFCDMEFEHISSTAIRQLEKYGKATDYLI